MEKRKKTAMKTRKKTKIERPKKRKMSRGATGLSIDSTERFSVFRFAVSVFQTRKNYQVHRNRWAWLHWRRTRKSEKRKSENAKNEKRKNEKLQ